MKDMVPVAGPVGRGGCLPFLICSPWKVGIDAFGIPSPGSWLDRMVVVHFNLDYSYPNMKNSDNLLYRRLFLGLKRHLKYTQDYFYSKICRFCPKSEKLDDWYCGPF